MRQMLQYLLLIAIALLLLSCAGDSDSEIDVNVETTAVPVEIAIVQASDVQEEIDATGVVRAHYDANVSAETFGRVLRIVNDVGSKVAAGDDVIELDDRTQRLDVQKSRAQLDIAAASDAKMQSDLIRMEKLYLTKDISESEIEQARLLATTTRGEHELTKAVLGLAEKALADTRVSAPFGGEITAIYADVGEMVAAGQIAFTIVQIDTLEIHFDVPAADISSLAVGQPAVVTVPAFPGNLFHGIVKSIAIKASESTRTYPVEVLLANSSNGIRPGMLADVGITTGRQEGVIVVPASAVLRRNGKTVVLVDVNSTAKSKAVTVSSERGAEVVISSGLAAGDRLIVIGQNSLQDGSAIVVTD
ncbi:MAG: efflux RND transporter periplasmic adaptor subunit [candidate division Zixibacteria bacterium]|nr:efflux RND transporter periplasmic adaptor subunit [candidate division Zixibacteria bacterium]MBU2626905.1 efflux RND transporter periplasmic adaptor subunit [candidate division Zixibacteria bacterium]